jgi:V-type H+-transporting ATPase subunit C
MSKGSATYFLVSLPASIVPSGDKEEALRAIQATVSNDHGTTVQFPIPTFNIGTLDALVQQADDLAKLDTACENIVAKVGDSLRNILEGDEEKIAQQKTINDSMSRHRTGPCKFQSIDVNVRTRRAVLAEFSMEQDQVSSR